MEKQGQPAQQSVEDLKAALVALAGGEERITPNEPVVLNQMHKGFTSRNQAQFRSQAADRLDALREWIDRSLRYHIVRLRYDALEEEPMVSYSYAAQDVQEGASKLTDLLLEAHEEDVLLRTIVARDIVARDAAKHGLGPSVAEAASRYATGYGQVEEVGS